MKNPRKPKLPREAEAHVYYSSADHAPRICFTEHRRFGNYYSQRLSKKLSQREIVAIIRQLAAYLKPEPFRKEAK